MDKNEKLLRLLGEERNSFVQHCNKDIERLYGKIEGADYMLSRLMETIKENRNEEDKNEDEKRN